MLIHIDGFDSYSTGSDLSFQYSSGSFPGIGTNIGRFGQGAMVRINSSSLIKKSFSTGYSEIWTGFALKTSSASTATTTALVVISSNSGIEGLLNYNAATNTFAFYKGDYVLQEGATGSVPFINNGWHFIEFHYKMDSSVGVTELYVDDRVLFSNSGQNTTQYGNTTFNSVWLGGDGANNLPFIIDDWYILDTTIGPFNTTRLGDSRIQTLRPSSDAGPNNGTPSSGTSHYAMVNAPQNDGGSTYITLTGTSGQEELFGMTSLLANPSTIYGAKVLNYARKTDAGALNTNSIISSNSIVVNSNVQGLLTTFSGISGIFESDPSTGVAWSSAGINAADCGFKIS